MLVLRMLLLLLLLLSRELPRRHAAPLAHHLEHAESQRRSDKK